MQNVVRVPQGAKDVCMCCLKVLDPRGAETVTQSIMGGKCMEYGRDEADLYSYREDPSAFPG
jgi:hypothetical protein